MHSSQLENKEWLHEKFNDIVCFAIILSVSVAGATITVDGNMDEWGISTASYLGSNRLLTPSTSVYTLPSEWSNSAGPGYHGQATLLGGETVHYHAEDTSSYFLDPESGGQNYDAEYLGAVLSGDKLYLGISTGQRQDNENDYRYFAPGDIRIIINGTDIYGIEVGGGLGGSGYTGVSLGDAGSTYQLTTSGYTDSLLPTDSTQTAGSVWQTGSTDWIIENVGGPPDLATQIKGGTELGATDAYEYNFGPTLGQHAFIELCVDLDLFGDLFATGATADMDIYWRPSCGNDDSNLNVEIISWAPPVPEPTSFVVWGLLAISMCVVARRRRDS